MSKLAVSTMYTADPADLAKHMLGQEQRSRFTTGIRRAPLSRISSIVARGWTGGNPDRLGC